MDLTPFEAKFLIPYVEQEMNALANLSLTGAKRYGLLEKLMTKLRYWECVMDTGRAPSEPEIQDPVWEKVFRPPSISNKPLIDADFSQIEPRMSALLSDEQSAIGAFMHCAAKVKYALTNELVRLDYEEQAAKLDAISPCPACGKHIEEGQEAIPFYFKDPFGAWRRPRGHKACSDQIMAGCAPTIAFKTRVPEYLKDANAPIPEDK